MGQLFEANESIGVEKIRHCFEILEMNNSATSAKKLALTTARSISCFIPVSFKEDKL